VCGWTREHLWPQSKGAYAFVSDVHALRPTSQSDNSARGNRDFLDCDNLDDDCTDGGGGTVGLYGYQPPVEVRGDVARSAFYVAVAYGIDLVDVDGSPTPICLSSTTSDQDAANAAGCTFGDLSTLLAWHVADPVDAAERSRNDAVQTFQNNRNPFIDREDWVAPLFGGPTPPPPPSPTTIVINEIMQNPSAVSDANGEWFELYNPSTADVDIRGWVIADGGSDTHTITSASAVVVPAGGYAVLGRNGNVATNGGVAAVYVYSSFTLGNGADEIILSDCTGSEMDRVEWDGGTTFPNPSGASMSLVSPALDNNVGSNWCVSTTTFGGDLGTPGAANDCPTQGQGPPPPSATTTTIAPTNAPVTPAPPPPTSRRRRAPG
jgi:hypothetical protein